VSDVFADPFEYVNYEREFSKLSSGGNVTCFPADSEVKFTKLKMNFFNS
jgi:hypothetical protein